MNLENIEKYRSKHPLGFDHSPGDDYGWFEIPSCVNRQLKLKVMVAPSKSEWKHVSVSTGVKRCPTWEEMCQVKELIFEDHEIAVQFHPAKSEYVNLAENCLHLWSHMSIKTPPRILV